MTQRTLIPFLLVGLPIGLGLSVVAALYLYYNPLDIPLPSRPSRSEAAAFLRRSPNEMDLRDYRRILTTDLAMGPGVAPERLGATANWISSTLGPTNLGLAVRTVERDPLEPAGAATSPTVVMEVPGTRKKGEALLVITGYHADVPGLDGAVSASTLMTVAGAFAGTPQQRTIVFAFLGDERTHAKNETPLDALVRSLKLGDLTIRGILDLRVAKARAAGPGTTPPPASALALAPRAGQPWTSEVREAFGPRKPTGLTLEFAEPSAAPLEAPGLAGWRSAPAPYVLLHLTPAAANDEAAPLALARSLEGVLQALANQ